MMDYDNEFFFKRLKKLEDNGVCLNCIKCTKKNCDSNRYIKNQKLYKEVTGDKYNS